MLNIVGDLLAQLVETLVASLARHQVCELLKETLQLFVLFEFFELVQLCQIHNVALHCLETLLDPPLHHRLVVILGHGLSFFFVFRGLLRLLGRLHGAGGLLHPALHIDSFLVNIALEHVQLVVLLEFRDEYVGLFGACIPLQFLVDVLSW